eukprot:1339108-Pyramimonas_sp.AAC.1
MALEEARQIMSASRCDVAGESLRALFTECEEVVDGKGDFASAYEQLRVAMLGSKVNDVAVKALSRHAATCVDQ